MLFVDEKERRRMKYVRQLELFQMLLKNDKLETGRLLGMDVGDRYVGLAISDPWNEIASPHSVLIRKQSNINSTADNLQDLVRQFSLVGFVIGYPLALWGFQSPEAFRVKLFVEQLQKTGRFGSLSYTYWDERLTTKVVESMLKPLNLHPVQKKRTMDKFAAVGILQGCLDNLQRHAKARVQSESSKSTT
eukprot:Gb_41494 [translate_table: standard]